MTSIKFPIRYIPGKAISLYMLFVLIFKKQLINYSLFAFTINNCLWYSYTFSLNSI